MDNKYGELYTEDELVAIVQTAVDEVIKLCGKDRDEDVTDILERFNEGNIREVARTENNRMFLPGEPLFVLRGQDRRALGAIRWYRDHQFPSAPQDHLDSIEEALARFEVYRKMAATKEPD